MKTVSNNPSKQAEKARPEMKNILLLVVGRQEKEKPKRLQP